MTGRRLAALFAALVAGGLLVGGLFGAWRELAMEARQFELDQDPGGV